MQSTYIRNAVFSLINIDYDAVFCFQYLANIFQGRIEYELTNTVKTRE